MAPSAPKPPLRRLLDQRVTELLADADRLLESQASERAVAAGARARLETADQLNQAVRRLRQSADVEELRATLVDAAGGFTSGVALLLIENGVARGERVRGVPEAAADTFRSIEIPIAEAAALAGAVDSKDPVISTATPAEVSPNLVTFLGHSPEARAAIFPVIVLGRVQALLYCWDEVENSHVELLAQVAGAVWDTLAPAASAAASSLVSIAPVEPAPQAAPPPKSAWDSLTPEERRIHLAAQRFARVRVAEMRLRNADEVQSGRVGASLYDVLGRQIDSARESMRAYFAQCPSMVDYLHVEMLRTLANDEPELLGEAYPGPLV
jgi:hypothetical protein